VTRTEFSKVVRVGRTRMFLVGLAAAVLALGLLVLVGGAGPARAAFPGNNGKIAFQSDRDGPLEIYTVGASGGETTRITFPPGGNAEAAYSPDGFRIVFNRGNDIHVMNATGMNPNGTGSVSAPLVARRLSPPGPQTGPG
jgi:Tol biopolymer transport system component